MDIQVVVIAKPHPHCPITFGHPCFRGYVPSGKTNIRRTFALAMPNIVPTQEPYAGDEFYPDNRRDY